MHCFIEYISVDRIAELSALERYDYIVVRLRVDNILQNTALSEQEKAEHLHVIVNHIKQMTDVFANQVVVMDGEPICYSAVSNADIIRFINDQNYTVYAVTYQDKFFDYGIVGTMIVKEESDGFKLLSFYLSCKVLKR